MLKYSIVDLAPHSGNAEYLKWLLKQNTVDPYLAEAFHIINL